MVDIDNDNIANAVGVIALQIHDGGGIKVRRKNRKEYLKNLTIW
jgi:hypothetical protein